MSVSLLKLCDIYERVTFGKSNNSANVPDMSLALSLMVTSQDTAEFGIRQNVNIQLNFLGQTAAPGCEVFFRRLGN